MTIPPLPADFAQLAQWLVMPAVLGLIANLIINDFFASATPKKQNVVRFVTFIVAGIVSFGLTRLAPDFVVSIEPLWAVLAGVIGAYYAVNVAQQIWVGFQLLGLRLLLGREGFSTHYVKSIKRNLAANG